MPRDPRVSGLGANGSGGRWLHVPRVLGTKAVGPSACRVWGRYEDHNSGWGIRAIWCGSDPWEKGRSTFKIKLHIEKRICHEFGFKVRLGVHLDL